MSTVDELLKVNFLRIGLEDKFRIKALGRPTPQLSMDQKGKSHGAEYVRKFSTDFYEKYSWLCGCDVRNAMFCFPCLLFGGEPSWTKTGVRDLRHINERAKKHELLKTHMNNVLNLNVLGKARLCEQSDSVDTNKAIRKHNEEVKKNRAMLSYIIDVIKFCGRFQLHLRGDSQESELDLDGFRGLLEYTGKLDPTLRARLDSPVFESISATLENDLKDCMFQVYQEYIAEEIKTSHFLSVIAEETTDLSEEFQMVIIFRYEVNCKPVERFWTFVRQSHYDAGALTQFLLHELQTVLGEEKDKLIAQSYDGASVLSDRHEAVRSTFPNAHLVRNAHQTDLFIAEHALACVREVKVFFNNLAQIRDFFSDSSERRAVLDSVVSRTLPEAVSTELSSKSLTVIDIFEYRGILIQCFEELESCQRSATASEAGAYFRLLHDNVFVFWLTFFYTLMPHANEFWKQLQRRDLTSDEAKTAVKSFISHVHTIQDNVDQIFKQAKSLSNVCNFLRSNQSVSAMEVCDIIKAQAEDQFHFTAQLSAARLLSVESFQSYSKDFPNSFFVEVTCAYPMLDRYRLRSQLEVLYERPDCRSLTTVVLILQFIVSNDVEQAFCEIAKLARIVLTTPMTPEGTGREPSSSSLERAKTSLKTNKVGNRLNALTALATQESFIRDIDGFNERVLTRFVTTKDHRIDLIYRSM